MSSSRGNLEYYQISLEEIKFATEDFNPERCIGEGGFGKVYIGELSKRWQRRTSAIKRLSPDSYQGEHEFRTEVQMISRFHHKNIISFIGYCDEGNEKIIVYDYATKGSVDYHLEDQNKKRCLTWIQRLKICLGTARGLNYLHTSVTDHNRVIHRDIKSANILLDENLVPKICDFGLSKLGPRNQQSTQLYTKVAGTQSYVDPLYQESGILRKESDVYSYGVVLFEMLSGMLAYKRRIIGNDRQQFLIGLVRQYDDNDQLDKLIDPFIKDQIDSRSFNTFKQIACQCISLTLVQRPRMDKVIERIEEAIKFQKSKLASPSTSESVSQVQIQTGGPNRIDTDGIDEVIIRQAEKEDEATVITINCPDTIGLGSDLCRNILLFGLSIVRCDISTDGKWCFIVFWVVGEPGRPWSLLKKRLSEACSSAKTRIFNRSESHPPKHVDVFLIKICCHDQRVLPDMIRTLCELGLVIKRIKVSTTPNGMATDLFSVTDTRELLHTKKRKEDIHDHLKAILGDNILSCEIEMVDPDLRASSNGPPSFIPLAVTEEMFNIEMLDVDKHEISVSVSITNDNSINHADHTLLHIVCPDRKGVLYDVMRTLKDYNIQISYGRSRKDTTSCALELYLVQADGKKIVDPSKQSALCSHIRMELFCPLRVGFVNRGPNVELLVANTVGLCGKGRPLVLYDITLALRKVNMDIFSAEISRHLIGGHEWEVYRVLLNEGDIMFVHKGKIEEAVRKILMGWDQR